MGSEMCIRDSYSILFCFKAMSMDPFRIRPFQLLIHKAPFRFPGGNKRLPVERNSELSNSVINQCPLLHFNWDRTQYFEIKFLGGNQFKILSVRKELENLPNVGGHENLPCQKMVNQVYVIYQLLIFPCLAAVFCEVNSPI